MLYEGLDIREYRYCKGFDAGEGSDGGCGDGVLDICYHEAVPGM
jgi:hypothetical protein